jgi:NDP-sugar pyrophosphorylase family protein
MDAILPAAGSATRMRGLPKFLLPCGFEDENLLERHIAGLIEFCENIYIPINPIFLPILEHSNLRLFGARLIPMTTQTMMETIFRVVEETASVRFMMIMPDTYFQGTQPYSELALSEAQIQLALWRIRSDQNGKLGQVDLDSASYVRDSKDKDPSCTYIHSWGAMALNSELLKAGNDRMPHLGHLINPLLESGVKVEGRIMEGQYFDCGTPSEYVKMLRDTSNE